MSDEPKPKLSIEDPVSQEILGQFTQLQESRLTLAERMVNIEQEKLRLLSAVHEIDQQKNRLFDAVLMERGIPPTTPVSLDSTTGKLQMADNGTAAKTEE